MHPEPSGKLRMGFKKDFARPWLFHLGPDPSPIAQTGVKSFVESFVWRIGEAVRRQMLQKADGKDGDRISATTDLFP